MLLNALLFFAIALFTATGIGELLASREEKPVPFAALKFTLLFIVPIIVLVLIGLYHFMYKQ